MSAVTVDQVRAILTGTETRNMKNPYRVSLAVRDSWLGKVRANNGSSFSFGKVQLDIGRNGQAQSAYLEALDVASGRGLIDQNTKIRLKKYVGVQRPDLPDPNSNHQLHLYYEADRILLNSVFSQIDFKSIVDHWTDVHLQLNVVNQINSTINAVQAKWISGPEDRTVFSDGHPDRDVAVAALASIVNRYGNLTGAKNALLASEPNTLQDLKKVFLKFGGESEWSLVGAGASNLYKFDRGIPIAEVEDGDALAYIDTTNLPNSLMFGNNMLMFMPLWRPDPGRISSPVLEGATDDGEDIVVISSRVATDAQGAPIGDVIASVQDVVSDGARAISRFVPYSQFGSIFGSAIGRQLGGSDPLQREVFSVGLGSVLQEIGAAIDNALDNPRPPYGGDGLKGLAEGINSGSRFVDELSAAGVGALSSYLVAELVNAVGVGGIGGEVLNSAGGATVSQIASNLANLGETFKVIENGVEVTKTTELFTNIGPVMLNVIGSWAGTKLASELVSFDTIGGQLGASIGASVGSFAMVAVFAAATTPAAAAAVALGVGTTFQTFAVSLGAAAGPLGALAGAFLGYIAGGLIGSLFGGTPRSGADVVWDVDKGTFAVANVSARKGGSKEAARSMAEAVAGGLNGIIASTGAKLVDAAGVEAGNYGMIKSDYVLRDRGAGKDTASARFSSTAQDAAGELIDLGSYHALEDMRTRLAGGDIHAKRALAATLDMAGGTPGSRAKNSDGEFSMTTLAGNLSIAGDYARYLQSSVAIDALIASEPESVFAAGWAITFARAAELGLNRRNATDWVGGFGAWLDALEDGTIDGESAVVPAQMEAWIDAATGERAWIVYDQDGEFLGVVGDTIGAHTLIAGKASDETIDLRGNKLTDQRGYIVDGVLQDAIAVSGSDFTAKTATVSFAAGQLRQSVSVVIANDGVSEAAERFLGKISQGDGVTIIGGQAEATLLNGAVALPVLQIGRSYALETDGYAVFRVSLSKALASGTVSATLSVEDITTSLGVDRGSTIEVSNDGVTWTASSTISFSAGQSQKYVRVAVLADNGVEPDPNSPTETRATNVEGNEQFRLTASVSAGASLLANTPDSAGAIAVSGIGTIVDAESGATSLAWIDGVTVDEASGQVTFSIARTNAATAASVNFATEDRRELKIDIAATVDAGDGNDTVYASDRGDNVFGGAGNDTLIGGKLDDWLLGGEGNDRLFAGSVTDGSVSTAAAIAADGGSGNYLDGGAGDDKLYGSTGSDWLTGGDGVDELHGGAGGDILDAGAGADNLAGAASIFGGAGSDQYIFGFGYGQDVIFDDPANGTIPNATADSISARISGINSNLVARNWAGDGEFTVDGNVKGGEDAIVFGAGVTLGDIVLERSGATGGNPGMDLIIRLQAPGTDTWTGDTLTIKDWYEGTRRVEWLRFASGEEIRIGDFLSFKVGTSGADTIVGTNGNDFLVGTVGDDKIFGLGGDDIGIGGTGNDLVSGDADDDWVLGGEDDDVVLGGQGNDIVFGDGGNDRLYGGAGNDLVVGGKGNDEVIGGAGDDIFRYNRGDGRDTMFDELAGSWELVWDSGYTNGYALYEDGTVRKDGIIYFDGRDWIGRYDYDELHTSSRKLYRHIPPLTGNLVTNAGNDTLEFGVGIDIDDLVFRASGANLDVVVTDNGGSVSDFDAAADLLTLKDWYTAGATIENFQFVETGRQLVSAMMLNGTQGGISADLEAGSSSVWFTGDSRDNSLTGGTFGDILSGGMGADSLKGMGGSDVLYGGAGDDTLDGGSGADILIGGSGSDTVSYDSFTNTNSTGLYLFLDEAYRSFRTYDAAGDSYTSIENLTGSVRGDIMQGDAGDNILDGNNGSDTIYGGAGDDTYIFRAASGTDTIVDRPVHLEVFVDKDGYFDPSRGFSLEWNYLGFDDNYYTYQLKITNSLGEVVYDSGETGTYYKYLAPTSYAPGRQSDGRYITTGWQLTGASGYLLVDTIRSSAYKFIVRPIFSSGDGGYDTIELGDDLSLADIYVEQSGNDLVLRLMASTSTKMIVTDFFADPDARIEALQFQDGLSANLANLRMPGMSGTAEDELFIGNKTSADTWNGGAGNDVISGLGGHDNLSGGDGDDVIEGGAGNDIIDGGSDSQTAGSTDTSTGFGDTARYVSATGAVVINLAASTTNIIVTEGGASTDTIIKSGGVSTIEHLVGSDNFGDTLTGDARANRLFGLGGDDVLSGGAGDDVLIGGDGVDSLFGGDGDDNIDAGDGDDVNVYGGAGNDLIAGAAGNDVLHGDDGDDMVDGGEGNDTLHGGAGNDQLGGGKGADTLFGDAGDDQLAGGDGDDTLDGGSGNDILLGEGGNDILRGGAGDDIYSFAAGSGEDEIQDAEGINQIIFADTDYSRLWLTRAGDHLRIGVMGSNDEVVVRDYFAATSPGRIREIIAGDRSIYLAYAGDLISAMTAISVTPPATLPADLADEVEGLWWLGGSAVPLVVDQVLTTLEDTPLHGTVGAIDHDENVSSYAVAALPEHGSIALNALTGAWVYTPSLNFYGSDRFDISVSDANGHTVVQTVDVTIESVNDAPTAIALVGAVSAIAERDRLPSGSNPAALMLGTIEVTDVDAPDAGDFASHAFTVSNPDFEVFEGKLYLKASARPDFEANGTISVTVTATDRNGAGLSTSQLFSFSLTDIDDYWYGTSGSDSIAGSNGRAGLGGRDIIYGYAGQDTIDGGAGNDDIYGGADNDTLSGGAGDDRLYGEDGDDILNGGLGADLLEGGAGNDILNAGGDTSGDILRGGAGEDQLTGSLGNDVLEGGDGNDRIAGLAGADTINGGLGTDTVDYGASAAGVHVYLDASGATGLGDAAGDVISNIENVIGSNHADIIAGDAAANRLEGGMAADYLYGRAGNDELLGQDGNDFLYGEAGGDTLFGGEGNDHLEGGADNDVLYGDAGIDTLLGGDGDDVLDGGSGNDILDGGNGNDTYVVWSNSGADTINNFDPSGSDIDVVGYRGGITREHLWFERSGNDLLVTVVGTGTSTRIANWYTITTSSERANYKIDFFVAEDRYTREVNAEGLVSHMAGYTKPTTQEDFNTLRANATFNTGWMNFWENNQAPAIDVITNQTINEDGTLSIQIRVTDDITPLAGINVVATAVDPLNPNNQDLSKVYAPSVGPADANGYRTLTINTKPNASGLVRIKIDAVDAGGLAYQRQFDLNISPVADTPTLTRVEGVSGTLDTGGLPIYLEATLADTDGSEVIDKIRISNVPAGLSFNMGSLVSAGVWEFTPTRIGASSTYTVPGLQLNSAPGWSQDLVGGSALQVAATSKELANGQTATTASAPLNIVINSRPTNITTANSLSIAENVAGPGLAWFVGQDPDGDAMRYEIVPGYNAGGLLTVRSDGYLMMTGASPFNYEAAQNIVIRVRATDYGNPNLSYDKAFTLSVVDVNEANSFGSNYSWTIDENRPAGTAIGVVVATDVDTAGSAFATQRYYFWNGSSVSGTSHDGRYRIDAVSGLISTNTILNYEGGSPSASYTVIARDNAGNAGYNQASTTVTLGVSDVNEAPTLIVPTIPAVGDNSAPGYSVATFGVSDPDTAAQNRNFSFELVGQEAPGVFALSANGDLTLHADLDYGVKQNYWVDVRVRDQFGYGLSSETSRVTISVYRQNSPPNPTGSGAISIQSRRTVNYHIGTIYPNEPDGDPITFRVISVEDVEPNGTEFISTSNYTVDSTGKVRAAIQGPGWRESHVVTIGVSDGFYERFASLSVTYNNQQDYAPIVLDLDGDGVELVSLVNSTVTFDINGDGLRDVTGWAASDDGFLVFDRNGDGAIDRYEEISFAADLDDARSDLEGLQAFDTDGDGFFDTDDALFAEFQVWQDVNQDGISQASELTTLAERGIRAINLTLSPTGQSVEGATDNVIWATSEYILNDGTSRDVGDVFLAYYPSAGEDQFAGSLVETDPMERDYFVVGAVNARANGNLRSSYGSGTPLSQPAVHFSGLADGDELPSVLKQQVAASVVETESLQTSDALQSAGLDPTHNAGLPEEQISQMRDAEAAATDTSVSQSALADEEPQASNTIKRQGAISSSQSAAPQSGVSALNPVSAGSSVKQSDADVEAAQTPDLEEPFDTKADVTPAAAGAESAISAASSIAAVDFGSDDSPLDEAVRTLSRATVGSFGLAERFAMPSQLRGTAGVSSAPATVYGDDKLSRLVAAMASFQSGSAIAPVDIGKQATAMSQMADLAAPI